jgi:hypothetical protein
MFVMSKYMETITRFVCVKGLVFPLIENWVGSLALIGVRLVSPSVGGWVLGSLGSLGSLVLGFFIPFPLVVLHVLILRKGSVFLCIHVSLSRRCRQNNMGRGCTCEWGRCCWWCTRKMVVRIGGNSTRVNTTKGTLTMGAGGIMPNYTYSRGYHAHLPLGPHAFPSGRSKYRTCSW